jgi:predicted transglutaminase-like cysteine proteinase
MALVLAVTAGPATARPYPPILGRVFGAVSIGLKSPLEPIPLWSKMLSRWQDGASCKAGPIGVCTTLGWKEALQRGQGLHGLELLKAVNDAFDDKVRHPYRTDAAVWGKTDPTFDYWETPYEFLARSGDCEDYAIAKYMALKALGIPEQDMLILTLHIKGSVFVGQDGHAVLLVFLGNEGWVLDNRNSQIMRQDSAAVQYTPLKAVNSRFWAYLSSRG